MARPVGRGEGAHVLDHADHLQIAATRHVGHPRRDLLGGEGGRGHDEQLGARQQARQRHLDVAGAGRHVDEEVVHLAPPDVGEELLERAGEDEPPPHQRRLGVVDEEPHRDDLDPTRRAGLVAEVWDLDLVRIDLAVGAAEPAFHAEHARHAEAPDVGVEHSDGPALCRERGGEVHRHRRLAHAALAAGDCEDACRREHFGPGRVLACLPAGALHHRRLLVLGHLAVLDPYVGHAPQPADLRFDVALDLRPQRAAGRREGHLHGDLAAVGHADVADHAELDDAGAQLGVDDPLERAAHVVRARRGTLGGPMDGRAGIVGIGRVKRHAVRASAQ